MNISLPSIATILGGVALAVCGASLCARMVDGPTAAEVVLAGYATSLAGRTPGQRHNARLAAEALDGRIVKPGTVFSFNRAVRSWSGDRGYVKAPVSYDGEMVRAYGGGVCQTSTTLYNAALLAGLPIVERHSHVYAAHYAPPGQDAAVAQPGIDLRFQNPHAWPIRIRATVRGDRLDVRLVGAAPARPGGEVELVAERLGTELPGRLTRALPARPGERLVARSPGIPGCRVVVYRVFRSGGREVRRERVSDDTYAAMDRVVQTCGDDGS